MSVTYKLNTFEGPLDLLLHLIDNAEVDIYDIPIAQITNQYMEYLAAMQELELEITSEFLVMAATLLSIKSKMLLPKPPADPDYDELYMTDEEIDPRAELVARLIEYRKFKAAALQLRDREFERSLIYTREPEDLTPYLPSVPDNPLKGIEMDDLVKAFRRALLRMATRNQVAKIRKDEISVKDRMAEVVDLLTRHRGKVLFSRLLGSHPEREEIVVTFLALLELMKMKSIVCYQDRLFDDIVIQAREDGAVNGLPSDEIRY